MAWHAKYPWVGILILISLTSVLAGAKAEDTADLKWQETEMTSDQIETAFRILGVNVYAFRLNVPEGVQFLEIKSEEFDHGKAQGPSTARIRLDTGTQDLCLFTKVTEKGVEYIVTGKQASTALFAIKLEASDGGRTWGKLPVNKLSTGDAKPVFIYAVNDEGGIESFQSQRSTDELAQEYDRLAVLSFRLK